MRKCTLILEWCHMLLKIKIRRYADLATTYQAVVSVMMITNIMTAHQHGSTVKFSDCGDEDWMIRGADGG